MKQLFFLSLLFFCVQNSYPQDFNTVYYNSDWEITSVKFGKYYRNSGFDTLKFVFDSIVTDHYMDGSIEMTGKYIKGQKEGDFTYYYPDHSVKFESSYSNNERTGIWTEYFDNGAVRRKIKYGDNKEKLIVWNDQKGNNLLNDNFKYSLIYYESQNYRSYSSEKPEGFPVKYKIEGIIKDGYKNGTWILTEYHSIYSVSNNNWVTKETPETRCSVKYKDGNYVSGIYFLDNSIKKSIQKDIFTFLILEPEKISRTESIFFESGQLIKQNYIIKALQRRNKNTEQPVILKKETEIPEYFSSNYTIYAKKCSDTLSVKIALRIDDSGKIEVRSISPKIPGSFEKEVYRVINSISRLEKPVNHEFSFIYRILCFDELDYKK